MRFFYSIGSVATLLGLIGTIAGMIKAFMVTAKAGDAGNKVELLSTGIYEAMVCTFGGLAVAVRGDALLLLLRGPDREADRPDQRRVDAGSPSSSASTPSRRGTGRDRAAWKGCIRKPAHRGRVPRVGPRIHTNETRIMTGRKLKIARPPIRPHPLSFVSYSCQFVGQPPPSSPRPPRLPVNPKRKSYHADQRPDHRTRGAVQPGAVDGHGVQPADLLHGRDDVRAGGKGHVRAAAPSASFRRCRPRRRS